MYDRKAKESMNAHTHGHHSNLELETQDTASLAVTRLAQTYNVWWSLSPSSGSDGNYTVELFKKSGPCLYRYVSKLDATAATATFAD